MLTIFAVCMSLISFCSITVTVSTIQLAGTNKTTSFKIAFMTDDLKNITNQVTCFKMDGTPLDPVGMQSVLPDLKDFKVST